MPTPEIQTIAAVIFAIALVHTFATRQLDRLGRRWPKHAGVFHLLGEVEVVFGFWAAVLIAVMAAVEGPGTAIEYAESRRYTEPLFVFVIMVIAASRPVLEVVRSLVGEVARRLPAPTHIAKAWLCFAFVPLLGSVVTEPAAMTLAALMLAPQVFRDGIPEGLKYVALGTLFVNVSIGGTLTSFAAPPVLIVAAEWGWDSAFMLGSFGWRATLAVIVNATLVVFLLRKHLAPSADAPTSTSAPQAPWWVIGVHFAAIAGVVALSHHPVMFLGVFLLFVGFTQAYRQYQAPLLVKEGLLVGFFLAGLVVIGGLQRWWLEPAVSGLPPALLFFGSIGLTAIVDNAALTYLGSQIPGLSDSAKYFLVAGSVAGGGLTVIANAPNPAGVALLRHGFADQSIGAGALLLGAVAPTVLASAALYLL